jgi:hypothetical protein
MDSPQLLRSCLVTHDPVMSSRLGWFLVAVLAVGCVDRDYPTGAGGSPGAAPAKKAAVAPPAPPSSSLDTLTMALAIVKDGSVAFDPGNKVAACRDCIHGEGTGAGCSIRLRRLGEGKPLEDFKVYGAGDSDRSQKERDAAQRLVPMLDRGHFVRLRELKYSEHVSEMQLPDTALKLDWSGGKIVISGPSGKTTYPVVVRPPYRAELKSIYFAPGLPAVVATVQRDPGRGHSQARDILTDCELIAVP